ncbi:Panacea domain-containing protein [Allorhizobium borbori]|uniref:Putative phage-associated protein n=1 Tax=Allorhizobium borbori TaxID=485907 RepID=A0A7W6P0S4_9HYPH|nr:putative phage-associated protein [Allorhizobium borbori]
MAPYKAKSVANAFLTLANRDGYDITPMQLQKLLYYANGYFMAENDGQPLINEYFEAWDYGPVVPTVYYEFREYVNRPIKRFAYTFDREVSREIVAPQPVNDDQSESVISWVWDNYRDLSGPQLSNMTHKTDGPWDRARRRASNSQMRNERLETADLLEYFRNLI